MVKRVLLVTALVLGGISASAFAVDGNSGQCTAGDPDPACQNWVAPQTYDKISNKDGSVTITWTDGSTSQGGDPTTAAVPEPGVIALLGLAVGAGVMFGSRRNQKR